MRDDAAWSGLNAGGSCNATSRLRLVRTRADELVVAFALGFCGMHRIVGTQAHHCNVHAGSSLCHSCWATYCQHVIAAIAITSANSIDKEDPRRHAVSPICMTEVFGLFGTAVIARILQLPKVLMPGS